MEDKPSSEEIGVQDLFRQFGEILNRITNLFLRFFNFILRNLIILIVLVVVGATIGYFMDKTTDEKFETDFVVSTVVPGSGNYLEKGLAEFKSDLNREDIDWRKKWNIDTEQKPTVSFETSSNMRVRFMSEGEEEYIDFLKSNAALDLAGVENSLKEEAVSYNVKVIHSAETDANKVLEGILLQLRDNDYFKELSREVSKDLIFRKESNYFLLSQIDSLFKSVSKGMSKNAASSNDVVFNNQAMDLGELVNRRIELQEDNSDVIEKSVLAEDLLRKTDEGRSKKIPHNYIVIIPCVLVGLFFVAVFFSIAFKKSRELR